MRDGGRVSLPAVRRGLSPEGCRNRERQSQGSLTIGVQGVTVYPTERASRSQSTFLQENVRRLKEIQAKCRGREQPSRRHQPLRATRGTSANTTTTSFLTKTGGPANAESPMKPGEGVTLAGRGDSAHSDYYSLSEDPPDPPPPTHPQYPAQGWSANTTHTRHNASSRPHSPVVLRPLTTSAQQPLDSDQLLLLPDAGLSRDMRKMRMDSLVSRISSQRPACEKDYHQHYRSIENQHRQLLDATERINSSSGDGASCEDTTRTKGGQARAGTPPKMIRSYSFDRGTHGRRREGSVERKAKAGVPGELKALKKLNHRPSSPSPSSSSFSSPQPARRSSRNVTKTGRLTQDTSGGQDVAVRQLTWGGKNAMTEPTNKSKLTRSGAVQRAKNAVDQASNDTQPTRTNPTSRPESPWTDAKQDAHDIASCSGETNLNSSFSSNCDFYPEGHEEPESPRLANREDLKLVIRPDSQSTTREHGTNDPNQEHWDSSFNNLDFPLNSEGDIEEPAGHLDSAERIQHSSTPYEQTEAAEHEGVFVSRLNGRIDDSGGRDGGDSSHTPTTVTSSVLCEEDGAAASTATSTKSWKKEQQQNKTRGDTLRRSQSLKNVAHTPGEPPPHYQIGKIPSYLQARKEEKHRQEELARNVDPNCPPGHQPLPDHERLNTLQLLHKSQTQVLQELSSLPVAQDTLRVKRARLALEEKLTQIEDGMRIFSQPRVYIMNDE
ncbi:Enkurin domain-containing protein 1 [Chionoecetes opilio]|uniref:Enkurin domain-containing protein 1 n=1 Tax=Chionoecetes opilio TaxID=41210 RepID=A0A8J4Z4Y4_CHIOP|nr:Enkurin domain-containing protein 1 [Chionoecetes opilio]